MLLSPAKRTKSVQRLRPRPGGAAVPGRQGAGLPAADLRAAAAGHGLRGETASERASEVWGGVGRYSKSKEGWWQCFLKFAQDSGSFGAGKNQSHHQNPGR